MKARFVNEFHQTGDPLGSLDLENISLRIIKTLKSIIELYKLQDTEIEILPFEEDIIYGAKIHVLGLHKEQEFDFFIKYSIYNEWLVGYVDNFSDDYYEEVRCNSLKDVKNLIINWLIEYCENSEEEDQ